MEKVLGFLRLRLVTAPIMKSFKSNNGNVTNYFELTLTDGNLVFNRVTAVATYHFDYLEVGKEYCFGIIPRVKNVNAIANNGNQYNKAYNDFKVVGVFEDIDISKLKELVVMK